MFVIICYLLVYFEEYGVAEGWRSHKERVEESSRNWKCDNRKIWVSCVLGRGVTLDQQQCPGGRWCHYVMGQHLESRCL